MYKTLAEAADIYAQAGWPIFPLQPNSKEPFPNSHGFKDATVDRATIASWWARCPEANIGTATGVVVDVLDVDNRKDGNGFNNLDRLAAAGLVRGAVARSLTRNRGEQWFYPARRPQQGCRSFKGQWVDIKAAGGYVVLPPSVVPSDPEVNGLGHYEWAEFDLGSPGRPLDGEAIGKFLNPQKSPINTLNTSGERRLDGLLNALAAEREGNRNNLLWWAARKAVREGLNVAPLRAIAISIGLRPSEVDRTISSAIKAAQQ
jgi:hypothetical protein